MKTLRTIRQGDIIIDYLGNAINVNTDTLELLANQMNERGDVSGVCRKESIEKEES